MLDRHWGWSFDVEKLFANGEPRHCRGRQEWQAGLYFIHLQSATQGKRDNTALADQSAQAVDLGEDILGKTLRRAGINSRAVRSTCWLGMKGSLQWISAST
jgi:hypothetical protein